MLDHIMYKQRQLTSSFLIGCLLFLFLAWLLCLWLPVLCWVKVVTVGTLTLFLILEGNRQPFTIECDVGWGFVIHDLYYVEGCFFYTQFVESFYHWRMLYFIKCFFCIYWDNHMIFIFYSIKEAYHIYWFVYVELSLHPRDKSHLLMMYDPFNVLLNSVCYYFVDDFCIYAYQW